MEFPYCFLLKRVDPCFLQLAGRKKAVVARTRDCTLCRECVIGEGWEKRVQLRRVKEHFICMVYGFLVICNKQERNCKILRCMFVVFLLNI